MDIKCSLVIVLTVKIRKCKNNNSNKILKIMKSNYGPDRLKSTILKTTWHDLSCHLELGILEKSQFSACYLSK